MNALVLCPSVIESLWTVDSNKEDVSKVPQMSEDLVKGYPLKS